MQTVSPKLASLFVIGLLWFPCLSAMGQVDYDPEYDDEAAGDQEYSDIEAAGTPKEPTQDKPGPNLTSDDESTIEKSETPASDTPVEGDSSAEVSANADVGLALTSADEDYEYNDEDDDDTHTWEFGASRQHLNLLGASGLIHMSTAGSDDAGTFGVAFHSSFFKYKNYLIPGDENNNMWGGIHLRVTPAKFLEVFAGLESSANFNDSTDPELFQALGDLKLGVKGFYQVSDLFSFGGILGLAFMNPIGDVDFSFKGTSFGMDALTMFDFGAIQEKFPMRAHVSLGYYFDNSAKLIKSIEDERGGCGTDINQDGFVEYEGCLNPVERTALGINRNDAFRIGLGVDMALPYVSPIVEYNLEIPVNRQDFKCPEIPGSIDSCLLQEKGRAFHQTVTIGARVLPPMESLAIDIAVDIGLSGYAPTVHELSAEAPYRVILGLSYNFDPFPEPCPELPPPPAPVVEAAPVITDPPAIIVGMVHDVANLEKAIANAKIVYLGHQVNPQISAFDGRFWSYPMPEGPLSIEVSAEGYQTGTFSVEVPKTGELELNCPLAAELPKKGTVTILVKDNQAKPISGATVSIRGPQNITAATNAAGEVKEKVDAGNFQVMVEKESYLKKVSSIDVTAGGTAQIEIELSSKPTRSLVVIRKKRIVIKKKIHFESNSDEIKSGSYPLVDEIADVMLSHPEIKLVEIQGHTDNKGKRSYNTDLSERRAQSVRRYLVKSGVEGSRMQCKGLGPDKPVAPNITGSGRARNRRVEFHILEKDK